MENLQVQLIRPPVLVRRGPNRRVSMRSAQHWAFAFGRHVLSDRALGVFPTLSVYSDHESLESGDARQQSLTGFLAKSTVC